MKNAPLKKETQAGFNRVAHIHPDKILDTSTGKTILIDAILRADYELIAHLLESGASPGLADKTGRAPIHYAVKMGQVSTIRKLHECGARVDRENAQQETPLIEAMNTLRPHEVVECLLKLGADANIADKMGRLPLHTAAHRFDEKLISLLASATDNPSRPDNNGVTPLHLATQSNSLDTVKALLAAGASLFTADKDGETPLHLASYRMDDTIVKYFLTTGDGKKLINAVNINNGQTPLHIAVNRGCLDVAKLMLAAGADPNIADNKGMTPLRMAAGQYNSSVATILLLIQNGADMGSKSPKAETTPLIQTIDYRNQQIARILIDHGADVNEKDKALNTPLYMATQRYSADAMELLLKCGADPNTHSYRGQTPLHLATLYSYEYGVKILLNGGADPNTVDDDGKTPMHLAMHVQMSWPMIAAMIDKGGDPLKKDKFNVAPVDIAYNLGRRDLLENVRKKLAEKGIIYKPEKPKVSPPPPEYPPY